MPAFCILWINITHAPLYDLWWVPHRLHIFMTMYAPNLYNICTQQPSFDKNEPSIETWLGWLPCLHERISGQKRRARWQMERWRSYLNRSVCFKDIASAPSVRNRGRNNSSNGARIITSYVVFSATFQLWCCSRCSCFITSPQLICSADAETAQSFPPHWAQQCAALYLAIQASAWESHTWKDARNGQTLLWALRFGLFANST